MRGGGIEFQDALNLLHPRESDTTSSTDLYGPRKDDVIKRLRSVTVLDPCTGSGEFIVSTLNTLRRAERRLLNEKYDDIERVNKAIADQLFAVDVHPMAVQVTRFRFYLAMIGTRLALQSNEPLHPFPNLETRITAANSLATRLAENSSSDLGSYMSDTDMLEWRAVRDSYTYAHNPVEKRKLRTIEEQARQKLQKKLSFAMSHVKEWLENESLGNESVVAQCGLPLLFGREKWDIVIGNPPYQTPTVEERSLAQQYGYDTAKCGNLYCLFVELGVNLIGSKGNLTMVVPHSICFARTKQRLRDVCSNHSSSIHLRTYNNRPSPVFPPHPFIKGGHQGAQNVQRVTVMSLLEGNGAITQPKIHASCYIGLHEATRKDILRHRPSYPQPMSDQWTMAGTKPLARLLKAMSAYDTGENLTNRIRQITFPPTAGYFLTCLPQEILDSPRRKVASFPNDKYFYPRIALFNSTVFHAYWLMVGDAFDVIHSLFDSVVLPPLWISDTAMRITANAIGRKFCSNAVLNRSETVLRRHGKEFPNFDFQTHAPEVVRAADEICIDGYGLIKDKKKLLDQIRKVRDFRTWDM